MTRTVRLVLMAIAPVMVGCMSAHSGGGGADLQTSPAIRTCFEGVLKDNPSLRGRLTVAMDVQHGKVRAVRIEENTTGSKALEQCVRRQARTWHFDASVTGEISSTFALEPAS